MDYKLAQQLKEAGFPQEGGDGFYRWSDMKHPFISSDITMILYKDIEKHEGTGEYKFEDMKVSAPTLEEIIKEIETVFLGLNKLEDGWEATDHYYAEGGKTPLIAMAKLYIKLNETNRKTF